MSKRILKLGNVESSEDTVTKYVCDECGCEFEATDDEISEESTITCPCCNSEFSTKDEIDEMIDKTIDRYDETGFGFCCNWIGTVKMINTYYEYMGSKRRCSELQIKDVVRKSLRIAYNRALLSEDSTGADLCSFFLCKCCMIDKEIEFEINFTHLKTTYKTKL